MYALQNANAVTTNANELVKKAKAFIDRDIALIPNGIDTEHFKSMEKNLALAEALCISSLESGGLPPETQRQAAGLESQKKGGMTSRPT